VVATAEREPDVWASIGIHPHEAEQHADLGEGALIEAAAHPRVIAIGESGLDYYYDKSDRAVQRDLFRTHIAVSRATGLPLIVHTRDAEEDTVSILAEELGKGAFPALIHCFTASADFGRKVLDLGVTISLSGIITFKNARELQEFAPEIPDDRLLVETDSPFLAPVPHRGKTVRSGIRAATRRVRRGPARRAERGAAANTTRELLRAFRQGRAMKLIVLGCGTSTGVRDRQRLGRMRSPTSRRTGARGCRSWSRATRGAAAGRYLDRLAAAAARQRHRQGRRGVLDPRPADTATGSTT
jgi:TatD DNase family protein